VCLAEAGLHLILLMRIQLEIIARSSHAFSILKFPSGAGGGRRGDLKMAKYCALAGDKF
jgi:hypothetical protein